MSFRLSAVAIETITQGYLIQVKMAFSAFLSSSTGIQGNLGLEPRPNTLSVRLTCNPADKILSSK